MILQLINRVHGSSDQRQLQYQMAGYKTIIFVFITSGFCHSYVPPNFQTSALCDAPDITTVNFHEYVEIQVGSNRTFSCVVYSDTPLKEGYPKWTRRFPLPDHVITTGECPTLSNTTCSNLTLINVSQSDGSGYYTITAENECGSDNFTVNVEVVKHPHYCLNATELPPLLTPPSNISTVEGQTVFITATYEGDYDIDDLQAFWIVKTPNSKDNQRIFPNDDPPKGYNATVQRCPVTNASCCYFNISIMVDSVMVNQSGTELKSAASRPNDLTKYTLGYSRIKVYNIPTIIGVPGKECRDLTTGHSATFTCTYNASSDPTITITMWSVNGALLTHNTSHYTMITEYDVDQLDQVKSMLIISNVNHGISGTYTCWCEYNKSLIYGNEVFRSNPASVCLRVATGSSHSSIELWQLISAVGGGILILITLIVIILLTCCCYRKCKTKYDDLNPGLQDVNDERAPLLNGENVSTRPRLVQGKPLLNVAAATEDVDSNSSEDELHQVDPSLYNQQHRQGTDILEIDSNKAPSQAPSGTTEPVRQNPSVLPEKPDKLISGQTSNDFEEGLTPSHQKSLQQPGSSMVTGAGNFETVQEDAHKKDQQQHEGSNGFSAPQQVVVSTTPSLESANPHTTVSGRDGRTLVQEETSVSQPSVTEVDDEVTNNIVIGGIVRPSLKRLSTSKPIDSEREAPISGKPVPDNQESTVIQTVVECLPTNESDATNKVFNDIAVEFTTSINLDTLLPYLLKHQMLTDDEVYVCQSQVTPPSRRAQELLKYLKHKGDKADLKLLCCLYKETTHIGHKDVAVKLMNVIKYHGVDNKLICPTCNCDIPTLDVLDEVIDVVCASYPPENWEDLAIALQCSGQVIQQIGELADGTRRVQMILQHWRKVNPQATKEVLAAKFHDTNLDFVLLK